MIAPASLESFDLTGILWLLVVVFIVGVVFSIAQYEIAHFRARVSPKCPDCFSNADKAIYSGLPVLVCRNPECMSVSGVWSWVFEIYFDGFAMFYSGSYLKALWRWIINDY